MAGYFSYFPKILYDVEGNGNPKVVTDILRRVKSRDGTNEDFSALSEYNVANGETPETVSYKLYGTVDYYWIILLVNNIKDRYYDWPLNEQQFETYVNGKYANPLAAHHYEITQTSGPTSSVDDSHLVQVNSTTSGALAVSNYEYERRLQEQKRRIKIIPQEFIPEIIDEFKELIRR